MNHNIYQSTYLKLKQEADNAYFRYHMSPNDPKAAKEMEDSEMIVSEYAMKYEKEIFNG